MTSRSDRFHLDERAAQDVLLVQAVEAVDGAGQLLSHSARRQATEARVTETLGTLEKPKPRDLADALAARAADLLPALFEKAPKLEHGKRWSRLGVGWMIPVAILALIAGLATQGLGSDRYISVLAVPLMVLVVWNLAVMLLSPLLLLWAKRSGKQPWLPRLLGAWQRRLGKKLQGKKLQAKPNTKDDDAAQTLADVAGRFAATWSEVERPLALARLRRALHLGSACMVAGVVLGMYLRGLVEDYEVSWRSTFLRGEQVDGILGLMLTPAARVLSWDVPSVATYPWPETFDAAPFIHLWAVTALIYVILPRLVLMAWQSWRVRRLERHLPLTLPEAYVRRLRSAANTVPHQLDLWCYSYQPSNPSLEYAKRLLRDLFGQAGNVLPTSLDYGDQVRGDTGVEDTGVEDTGVEDTVGEGTGGDGEAERDMPRGRAVTVLCTLAQTPELEVHGELLEALKDGLAPGQSLSLWVDVGPYARRLGEQGTDRLDEKRRAWTRIAEAHQLTPCFLDLEQPADDDLLRLDDAVWPSGSARQGA